MRGLREVLADRAAWREYGDVLSRMDAELNLLQASGKPAGTPEYDEIWNDRMSYAANCYPGAPEAGAEPEAGQ